MAGSAFLEGLKNNKAGELFTRLYGGGGLETARRRYAALFEGLGKLPGDYAAGGGEVRAFSAPGRTELGGNHTDHNRGRVLAASIQLDSAVLVSPRKDNKVFYRSTGYPDVELDLSDLSPRPDEKGSTESLIRGIAAEFAKRGIAVGGFSANGDSTVFPGSGLSSSAAVEVLMGKVFDCLYGQGKLSALELAQIGQKAENDYFGKPCGLMDQTACASGGAVAIDFADPLLPRVRQIRFEPESAGFALCVVNTRGSHADLTPDYAAIPGEMKAVAAFFGKEVLRELDEEAVLGRIGELRKALGDRAVLRALHFFSENQRVVSLGDALAALAVAKAPAEKRQALDRYLALVNESGDSSWELLQNIYSPRDPAVQGLSIALALSRKFLAGRGACRVHGGGFAGTIQAYIPLEALEAYRGEMEKVFGEGAVTPLRIRPLGAIELGI
jgi:galactokinase